MVGANESEMPSLSTPSKDVDNPVERIRIALPDLKRPALHNAPLLEMLVLLSFIQKTPFSVHRMISVFDTLKKIADFYSYKRSPALITN
jgi:hypothetical protein